MARNPNPIQERSFEDIGLQIPFEVMVALGGASMATHDGHGFVVKGRKVGFIPVKRINRQIPEQYHSIPYLVPV